jgi:hypothetical protein
MSKTVQALILGFVVAFAVGGLLAFLESLAGAPDMTGPVIAGAGAGVASGFVFANLSGNRRIANASQADKEAALTSAPPDGKALLFLFRRGYIAKLVGMDFAVDGKPVAQLKSPHFTRIVVPAGAHIVTAAFGGFAKTQARTGECVFTAPPGGVITVGARLQMGLVQGGIGLTLDPNPAQIRADLARRAMTPPDLAEI